MDRPKIQPIRLVQTVRPDLDRRKLGALDEDDFYLKAEWHVGFCRKVGVYQRGCCYLQEAEDVFAATQRCISMDLVQLC